jgi:hypothetical protein
MSARALEFVETWVSEKIKALKELPKEGDASVAQELATECIQAAQDDGIPESEIQEAFDDLTAFIGGEIEEARERASYSDEDDEEEEE